MKYLVQLIYFNAGGGHRSAALALQEVIAQKHPDWSVSLVNLFEVIDSDRYYQKLTGFAPEDLYNLRLKKGWTRGLATELKIFQAMIRLTLPKLKKNFKHTVDVIVDRLKVREDAKQRLAESFETALRHADGGLARFHGGGRGVEGRLDQALAASGVKPVSTVRHALAMGFARMAEARTTVIVDSEHQLDE